jgi:hypothetical protein
MKLPYASRLTLLFFLITLTITLFATPATSQDDPGLSTPGLYIQSNNGGLPPYGLHYWFHRSDIWLCTAKYLQGNCYVAVADNVNSDPSACTVLPDEYKGHGLQSWAFPQNVGQICKGYTTNDCTGSWFGIWDEDLGGMYRGRGGNIVDVLPDDFVAVQCQFDRTD